MKIKRKNVDHVSLTNPLKKVLCRDSFIIVFFFFLGLFINSVSYGYEKLQSSCETIRVLNIAKTDYPFAPMIVDFSKNLSESSTRGVLKHLHPRLDISFNNLDKFIKKIKSTVKSPFEISIFKLWKLNNSTKEVGLKIPCGKDKDFILSPHYSYTEHYVAWLQVLGQKELGRIFMTIVKFKKDWKIGFLHFSQWTHQGKDFESWGLEGDKDVKENDPLAGYLKYDLALKLLVENPHLQIMKRKNIVRFISTFLTQDQFKEHLQKIFLKQKIITSESFFSEKGVGLNIRFLLENDVHNNNQKKICHENFQKLKKLKWFQTIHGFKCEFVKKEVQGGYKKIYETNF